MCLAWRRQPWLYVSFYMAAFERKNQVIFSLSYCHLLLVFKQKCPFWHTKSKSFSPIHYLHCIYIIFILSIHTIYSYLHSIYFYYIYIYIGSTFTICSHISYFYFWFHDFLFIIYCLYLCLYLGDAAAGKGGHAARQHDRIDPGLWARKTKGRAGTGGGGPVRGGKRIVDGAAGGTVIIVVAAATTIIATATIITIAIVTAAAAFTAVLPSYTAIAVLNRRCRTRSKNCRIQLVPLPPLSMMQGSSLPSFLPSVCVCYNIYIYIYVCVCVCVFFSML
jgi:hypothetical protein